MDTLHALHELGFTDYEARAYLTLVQRGELNGYELSKSSGIPRANVYAVADKLVHRGAAHRVERGDGINYQALPPKQLLRSLESRQRRALSAARGALARVERRAEPAAVMNLRGDELLAKARQLVDATQKTLLIAIQPPEAAALADVLRMARERGVTITTLCLEACERECGGCQGEIHRYSLAPGGGVRWLVLVADRRTALVGQIGAAAIEGVVTDQRLVVELAAAYIQQSLSLAVLGSELAGRFEGLLSQEARQLLDRLYPTGDFPAYVRSLSGRVSP